jgi:ribonuclease PH
MLRKDGRSPEQTRPIRLIPRFTQNGDGNVLVEYGNTKVLCVVWVESGVPPFLRNSHPPKGWLTAEYAMLPGAANTRSKRERPYPSGRSQEIQRLIGRALRGIINLAKCPEITFMIDCDVLQADGGTRTASITGAYAALKMAVDNLLRQRKLNTNPIFDAVAGISVGYRQGQLLVDLNYEEDSSADLDMNVVLTQSGKILEIQGTAEGEAFTKEQVTQIIEAAEVALAPCFELQQAAAEGRLAEI